MEYTYPRDFVGKCWEDVVQRDAVTRRHQSFRLRIDPSCTEIAARKFLGCSRLIELVFAMNSCLTEIGEWAFTGTDECLPDRTSPFTMTRIQSLLVTFGRPRDPMYGITC